MTARPRRDDSGIDRPRGVAGSPGGSRRLRRLAVLLGVLTLLLAVMAPAVGAKPEAKKPNGNAGPKPDYQVDESTLPFDALDGATAQWGVYKNAGYQIEVPDNWNGDLLMWAHGFRGTGTTLRLGNPEIPGPLRQWLIDNGYAWAASSYVSTDYNVADGVKDTHALATRFNGLVGKPDKVYIAGVSMGGHITAVSIEQYPNFYDGALPVCGVLGDYELFDWFLDYTVAAQQLGTGDSTFPVDQPTFYGATLPAIKGAFSFGGPSTFPFALTPTGTTFRQLTELRSGGERPGYEEAFAFWNTVPNFATGAGNFLFDLGATDGGLVGQSGVAVQNSDVVYQFDTDPALSAAEQQFNDEVARVTADRSARHRNGLSNVPAVSGTPTVPVLTMHNLGDLFVPVLNEVEYAREVAANGRSDLLVQRALIGAGHCDVNPAEWTTAIADLVNWVENGVRPGGDDFLDPTAVADADFGCDYSEGAHFLGLDPTTGAPVFGSC